MIEFHAPVHGGMAEWLKAPVLKTGMGRKSHRGFESLSLRLHSPFPAIISVHHWGGARVADWDRLLSDCRGFKSSTEGSNPSLPAEKQSPGELTADPGLFLFRSAKVGNVAKFCANPV